jgi:hypothetical protein
MNWFECLQTYVSHIKHVVENPFFCTVYKSYFCPGFAKQIMPILLMLRYNGSLVTCTVVSLTVAKVSLCSILRTCLFSRSYTACACCLHSFVISSYIYGRFESRMQPADPCAPWKFSNATKNFFCRRCNFKR